MVTIPGVENINIAPVVAQVMYWVTYSVLGILIIAVFAVAYYYLTFNIKATVFPLYGSGKDGIFSIGKRKTNRVKWIKKRTAWKSLWPILNKKEREPFDDEYIYPGKEIYIFELNDQWFPGRVNINQSEQEIRSSISPVPYYIRNWQAIEHKQNAIEFAKHNFWEDNKQFIWMLIAIGICSAMCLITIYLSYKYAGGGVDAMQKLTSALNGMTNIQGKPLG